MDSPADRSEPPAGSPDDLQVLVLGMHRSGTSAIAGLLQAAGIHVGMAEELVPPRPENPRFFGERSPVVDLNERLLAEVGWTWDAPAAEPAVSPPSCDVLVAEGRRLMAAIQSTGVGAIKDPRLSLLLPWWRRILLDRFVAVIPVRSPDEVAWSLSVRDGLPFELGLALWAAYHRHLAAGLDGLPVVVVDYAALTGDPEPMVRSVLVELARLGISRELDVAAAVGTIHPILRRATQPARISGSGVAADMLRNMEPWIVDRVRGFEHFAAAKVAPTGWEVALLDLQRGVRRSEGRLATALRELGTAVADTAAARTEAIQARDEARHAEEARTAATRDREAQRAAESAVLATRAAEEARRTEDAQAREQARVRPLAARGTSGGTRETLSRGVRVLIARARRLTLDRPVSRRLWTIPAAVRPNPLFDAAWYRSQYRDVSEAGADPYRHYRRHGRAEGRDPNALFSTSWYLAQNPDVRASRMDPLEHYFLHGAAEGRDPSPLFDTDRYLEAYPDVRDAGTNPLLHYLRHGRQEGRSPRPVAHPVDGAGTGVGAPWDPARGRLVSFDPPSPRYRAGVGGAIGQPRPRNQRVRSAVRNPGGLPWVRELSPAPIPVGSQVLVMTGGDDRWLRMPGVQATHLPSDGDGRYPGVEPVSDTAVIAQVEWQRSRGAAFLVIPDEASGLIERLPDLARHIESRYQCVTSTPGRGVVRDLRNVIPRPPEEAAAGNTLNDGSPPVVSIVIPNFGPTDLLRACLWSLGETLPATLDIEVIVVDDASPTDSRPALERLVATLPAGRLLVNDTNRGFLASANRGASTAKGDILVLLNNDTVTLPGWLDAIRSTFREHPDAGVVGGRLVYPDGRLQEAGGLIFADGTAAKLGYGDADPDAPMYTFLRDTDYVSGAFLATPRALFESLDGLDPAYGFGYYEDTDYCLRVRRSGRRVLYQPNSVVIHVEGGTAGVDTSVGPKRSQVQNQARFAARWSEVVSHRPARPVTARPEDWYAAAIRDRDDQLFAT